MKQTILILLAFIYLISCKPTAKIITEKKEVAVLASVSFTNTKWILTSLNKKLPTFSMNEKPYIIFKDNNDVSGNAGCNIFSGNYEISDSSINFKNIIVTTSACPDLPIESDFLKVLSITMNYIKNNQTLELKDSSGRILALFLVKK
ncbi:MAG: META domain-containing protein [Ginsengibacter sp.]